MTRGILALLTMAATLVPAQPAPAVSPPLAVHEIVRVGRGGPAEVQARVYVYSDGSPGVLAFVQLAPATGGGWTTKRFTVGMYNRSETRLATYGAGTPVRQLPCPASTDVCGQAGEDGLWMWQVKFRPAAGHRYLLAAAPGSQVYVGGPWWVTPSALGARVVYSTDATAAGVVTADATYEAFHSATARGGKYGSGAFAMMPCEGEHSVGTATLASDGSEPAAPVTCKPGGYYGAFSKTRDGRNWTVTGPVAGHTRYPVRLLVFDFPKR